MNIDIMKVQFFPEHFVAGDIPKFRGFLAKKFPKFQELHNHTVDGGFRFVIRDSI